MLFKKIIFIIFIIFITFYLFKIFNPFLKNKNNKNYYNVNHISKKMNHYYYNEKGKLDYQIISGNIVYNEKNKITLCSDIIILYYENQDFAIWKIKAKNAKIKKDTIFLYNKVTAYNLNKKNLVQKILMHCAIINISKKSLSSNEEIIIIGKNFKITGKNIKVNFKKNIIEYMEDTKLYYNLFFFKQ
ncbi:MAG: LPS export ABC transporter periplasmic protein LptC [Arsenophonus sp.]|nr:MAG: LPS export ABC transporter periplasmic protein LptC [Arsenophonus sp.]